LNIPGYWSFTAFVAKTLWSNRNIFGLLGVVYATLTILLVGMASQDSYLSISNTLNSTNNGVLDNFWGQVGKAGLLFVTSVSGDLSGSLTETQQIYTALIALMTWLSSVWLLRNILAGHKVKLRDGLYGSGSPILPTFMISLLLLVQLLPVVIALIGYSAAVSTGLLAGGGIESMLFWIAAGLLGVMSIYFMTSTIFALIIVTIPGMYPFQAIKTAGDLVIGRRLRILMRLIWMTILASVAWIVVMIPMILLDMWVKSLWVAISWLPVIPVILLTLSSLTIIWVSAYVYLLYRRIIADDSEPA
jgi:hypothetical protein